MVFEVQDLAQASPATVSRCGMVYYDPEELKWFPYAKSWAQNLLSENRITLDVYNLIIDLFQKYIEPGLVLIKKSLKVGIHQVFLYYFIFLNKISFKILNLHYSFICKISKNNFTHQIGFKLKTFLLIISLFFYQFSASLSKLVLFRAFLK